MAELKFCKGCNTEKPLQDFSLASRGKYGRAYYCRPCTAAKRREHYARTATDETRAAAVLRQRKYLEDPEKRAATRRRNLQWAKDNPENVYRRNALWRQANPERHREIQARYRAANPERMNMYVEQRRARLINAPVNDFTAEQWRDVLHDFNYSCGYCLKMDVPLQMDHMQPLSKGGSHTRANIVPACADCNNSKGSRDLLQFLAFSSAS